MKLSGKKLLIYFVALLTVGIVFQNCGQNAQQEIQRTYSSQHSDETISLDSFNNSSITNKSVLSGSGPIISITSSSLDLDNSELSISANLADFNHTSSDSHYVISFGIQNSNNAEQASGNSSPTTFNGSVVSTPNPVCDIDQELLVKEAVLDTTNNTLDIVALVCNTSNDTQLSDWSVNAALGNVPTGESALDDQPLQNLVDSGGQPTPIAFDSFDQVKLALDDSNGSLNIEATVSDLAFDNGDDIQVTVNLANSDNNESAAGDATASASDSDNAAFNGPAGTCSNSGSELIIESVAITPDNGAKKIAIQAKACSFTHQAPVQNAQAWSISLGLSTDDQAGSAQSPVLEFDFTNQDAEELEEKIKEAKVKLATLVAAKGVLYVKKAAYHKSAHYHQSRINSYNRYISSWNRSINSYKKRIKSLYKKRKRTKSSGAKKRYLRTIRRYQKSIRTLRNRINSARRSISSHAAARNRANAAVASLQTQINQKMTEISAAQAELDALIAQRDNA